MKEFSAFVLVVIVFAGVYGIFRFQQSSSTSVARYFNRGTSIAATTCDLRGTSFNGHMKGTIRIDGTRSRVDWQATIDGVPRNNHAVSSDGKEFLSWSDGQLTGFIVPRDEFLAEFIRLSETGGACTPWWSSDDALFQPPFTVTFEPR